MEDVKWLLRRCGLPILLLLFFVIAGVFCWGKQHNFHECMEQLPLAESYHDVRYITDDADVSGKSFRGLQY